MGFFDFMKKNNEFPKQQSQKVDSVGDYLDKLTEKGELPQGWLYRNKEFVDKIKNEYTYFLNMWVDNRNKSPKEQYSTLKSFVLYLEDVEKICKARGECFEFWFYKIIASKDYITKRKFELDVLISNYDKLTRDYDKHQNELTNLDERIIKALCEHRGILQSDFVKLFDPLVQRDVGERLYWLEKAGKLQRIKSGRSYILDYTV